MTKLADIAGTKYFIDRNEVKLQVFAKACEACGDIDIDLAGCKFGKTVADTILLELCKKYNFHNSENPELDAILKNNTRVVRGEVSSCDYITIPCEFANMDEIMQYLNQIDSSIVYRLDDRNTSNRKLTAAIAICIILRYPDVVLDLTSRASEVFDIVRKNWLLYRSSHKSYQHVVGSSIIQRSVESDGKVYIPGVGRITEDRFVEDYCVLPAEFGQIELYRDAEYAEVMRNVFEEFRKERFREKRMSDFIVSIR